MKENMFNLTIKIASTVEDYTDGYTRFIIGEELVSPLYPNLKEFISSVTNKMALFKSKI